MRSSIHETARQLHAYMTFRAAREGVDHTLSRTFYADALRNGCRGFFGVQVKRGQLVGDVQRPDLFGEWTTPAGSA